MKIQVSTDDFEEIFKGLFDEEEETPHPEEPVVVPCTGEGIPVLACGHRDWYTAEEHTAAKELGHCCPGFARKAPILWDRTTPRISIPAKLAFDAKRPGFSGYKTPDKEV